MKPNELRIGNWVSHEDYSTEMFRVKTICYGGDENNYVVNTIGGKNGEWTNPIDLILPIPLTQELLVKCGFDDKDYKQGYTGKDYKAGCLTMDFVLSKPLKMGAWQDYYAYDLQDPRFKAIEHLHQLQNLFYTITGEELNIEL